ncbi:MAG: choline/carnitine O-acyltransferase [Bryobacterales bacterium]|nr:choline/carnitine O-acyltransferase [Bryobacterales bacterium]
MASSAPRLADVESAFPAADVVIDQLAELAISDPGRRTVFRRAMSLLGVVRHCEKTRLRMIALAKQGINPFDQETIDPIFKVLYPELSFSGVMEDGDNNPFVRAGKLVYATLQGKDEARDNTARESHLYGRTVALYRRGLGLRKRFVDNAKSETIVVATAGRFYEVRVYENGRPLSPGRLTATFQAIAADAQSHPEDSGHGALTGFVDRGTLAAVHDNPHDEGIRRIDSALFLLALDLDAAPEDIGALGSQIHIGGYCNRDYRKALQLVVCGNGKAGAVFSLFAGVEGVTGARFLSAIANVAAALPKGADLAAPAPFTVIGLRAYPELTRKAAVRLESAMATAAYSHRIDAIGKDRIKALGVSPDAFLHTAVHLAYKRHFGRTPEAYNFIDLSTQQFGSISRYPCTTETLRRFLEEPTRANLLAAFAAHKEAIAETRRGNHPLHYAYHYVFASPGIMALVAILLFTALIPRFNSRFLLPDLWMSNIPASPGLVSMCRHGMTLGFVRRQAYTCHYLLFPDHIRVNVSAREEADLEAWPVQEGLQEAFRTLEAILKDDRRQTIRTAASDPVGSAAAN